MKFNGKEVITWSVNDYQGLANNPEVREIDSEAAQRFGSASYGCKNDVWSHRLT